VPYLLLEIWTGVNIALLFLLVVLVLRFAHRAKSRAARAISHACAIFAVLVLYGSGLRMASVISAHAANDPFWVWNRMVLTSATSGAARQTGPSGCTGTPSTAEPRPAPAGPAVAFPATTRC